MAGELNSIIDLSVDDAGQRIQPASQGRDGFLLKIITPIYNVVKAVSVFNYSRHQAEIISATSDSFAVKATFFWRV